MQNYIFYNVEHEKNLVIADMSKHFFLLQNQNQIGRCIVTFIETFREGEKWVCCIENIMFT